MARSTDGGGLGYTLLFGLSASVLVAATLVLVFWVLPERYVLSSGFRESGTNPPPPVVPFEPDSVVRVAARPLPRPAPEPEPGPAERLWSEVLPLLAAERRDAAISRFRAYLTEHPGDRDVRAELAVTLLRADRRDEAVVELRTLLREREDPDRRLLLARTLRDLGRTSEADEVYERVLEARAGDPGVWLERARMWAWEERWAEASDVLDRALAVHPGSVPLSVEMARVRFAAGDPERAEARLAGVPDSELAAAGGLELREAIRAATATPEPPALPPPTLLERAVQAREADDFERARRLFEEAVDATPDDPGVRAAYANLLQYELEDLEGAREQLLAVERLSARAPDPTGALQYRLAQLEVWTGMNERARERLRTLLPLLEPAPPEAPVSGADVRALLADLARFDGDRVAAGRLYRAALRSDPDHGPSREGLAELRGAVDRLVRSEERPGAESFARVGDDTDGFVRGDVGGRIVEVAGDWLGRAEAGWRGVDGVGLGGDEVPAERVVFTELEAARWWRWATIRTAVRLGAQRVAGDTEITAGVSVGHRAADGSRTDVGFEHGPAYLTVTTLQSLLAGVTQDVLDIRHARSIGEGWEASATASVNRLRWDAAAVAGGGGDPESTRFDAGVALTRRLAPGLRAGISVGALGVSDPAPRTVEDAPLGLDEGRRLFWDPRLAVTAQPFLGVRRDFGGAWTATGRLGVGGALLDERESDGWEVAPQISVEGGLWWAGTRVRVGVEVFSSQGQFDGYRLTGARLTLGTRALPWGGGGG